MVLSTENIIFRKPDYFTSGRAQQFVLTTTSGVVPEGSKLRFIEGPKGFSVIHLSP